MKFNKSKLVAIIAGFISVTICILYLLLITVFDFRSFINEKLISLSENMAAVFYLVNYSDLT